MSDDENTNPNETPSPAVSANDVQVGTETVPNKRVCAFLIDIFSINVFTFFLPASIAWIFGLAYLLIRDALFRGKSIGKYVVGLRVVDMEGHPCNYSKSASRNLIFVVPIVSEVVEYIVMRYSKEARRLGDRMARTKVLDARPDRPDWWFFLLSILLIVVVFIVEISLGRIPAPPA